MTERGLRRALGALVLLALGASLVVLRCGVGADRSAERLDRGLAALARALTADSATAPAAFAEADRELAAASGAVLFDAYPLFALELSKDLRDPTRRAASPARPAREVLDALAAGRLDEALALAAALPRTLTGRELLVRLTADLVRLRPPP